LFCFLSYILNYFQVLFFSCVLLCGAAVFFFFFTLAPDIVSTLMAVFFRTYKNVYHFTCTELKA